LEFGFSGLSNSKAAFVLQNVNHDIVQFCEYLHHHNLCIEVAHRVQIEYKTKKTRDCPEHDRHKSYKGRNLLMHPLIVWMQEDVREERAEESIGSS
jgi:hypothetical protein